eukprot:m.170837 g.170837  ORF g.170837 m.170837 type:complete len:451 (+) comp31621_c0_seq1:37-1389(+)
MGLSQVGMLFRFRLICLCVCINMACVSPSSLSSSLPTAAPSCPSPPIDVKEVLLRPPRPSNTTINGMTLFDWERRVETAGGGAAIANAITTIQVNTSANWVVIAPMFVTDNVSDPNVRSDTAWTMGNDTIGDAVRRAHALGMKVMLKVHVQLACGFPINGTQASCINECRDWLDSDTQPCNRGNLGCNLGGKFGPPWGQVEWGIFFDNYGTIVRGLARDVVRVHNIEAFCISTELTCATSAPGTESRWRALLKSVHELTPNTKLVVAMHDTDLMQDKKDGRTVGFLDAPELDWLGFDAYHYFQTLRNVSVPTPLQWAEAWAARGAEESVHHVPINCTSPVEWYRNVSNSFNKPIVFTEWGYESTTKCGVQSGSGKDESEQCQADAFMGTTELLRRMVGGWWLGAFWWDWTASTPQPLTFGADGKMMLQQAMRDAWAAGSRSSSVVTTPEG